jgi:hypothetical protein
MNNQIDLVKIKGLIGLAMSCILLIIRALYPIISDNDIYQNLYVIISVILFIIAFSYYCMYLFKSLYPKEYERFKKY